MYIVLLRKGMSQWFGKGPLRGPGSEGSKGSACLWQAGSEGGGGGFAASFIKKGARLCRSLCRRVVFASAQGATAPAALKVADCRSAVHSEHILKER